MVVPYSKHLLKKYQCHINVEALGSISGIKYIFDYLHKGNDKIFCKIQKLNENDEKEIHDEIKQFIDGRYLSPMEAAWRLQEFPLCERSHSVVRLAAHTENQQKLVFEEYKENIALENCGTTLTAWFKLNKVDKEARNIKYINIPCYYRFETKTKNWIKRTRSQRFPTIGRLNIVSPKDSERFHLKLLLNYIKGATSFDCLRTHNIIYSTYRECALALGLIENDDHVFKIFDEACNVMMPSQLRKFFAWFLLAEESRRYYLE